MKELEKQPVEPGNPEEEKVSVNEETVNAVTVKENKEETCAVDSSPAEDISQVADRIMKDEETTQGACAIEGSPSLDLAEAADQLTNDEEKAEEKIERNIHSMNKEELISLLREIVEKNETENHKEVASIKQAYYALTNKKRLEELESFVAAGNDPSAFSSTPDEDEEEMKELLAKFKEMRSQFLAAKEEERQKNLEEKKRIIEVLSNISEDIDTINMQFPRFQQLQQEFKAVGEVPPGSENEIWKSYQVAVEQFYDRLKLNKELRDLDFKKNLEIKNQLIERAEALAEMPDPIEAFRILQTLHDQWRETGPVAREIREEIWNKFKDASTVINKRHQDFFQERKAAEQINETAKTELCEKAEAIDPESLKNFSEWDNATKEILGLQSEWKELGFASKKVNNALFARFRSACDKFFTAKAEYFKKTKEESKENLAKKEALCEKAEALAADYERKGALDEMQALQKEWKEIGMVRRKQGDEVWKRFCTALDTFYAARKKLFSGKKEEESVNLKAKQDIIDRLKEISEEEDRNDVIDTIRELQNEWQSTGFVPFKEKDRINKEYRAELDRLFGAFDIRESRQRVRRYENDIKKFAAEEGKLSKEKDKLLRALDSRIAELKTVENNLGFFNVKSSAGNTMVKEMERKLQKLKDEIKEIKEKIKLLDNQEKES
ncbi:MAG: DUF349 domain-containing protein [Muribaculaceae bacterium]|nr:DUF349 domain-containing protein [Muribaculaceae bacterium]